MSNYVFDPDPTHYETVKPVENVVMAINGGGVDEIISPYDNKAHERAEQPERDRIQQGCQRYSPGHSVHWIQVKLAMQDRAERFPVRLLEVDGQYVKVQLPDGTVSVWRFHDTSAITLALLENDEAFGILYPHGFLKVGNRALTPCMESDEWRDCLFTVAGA